MYDRLGLEGMRGHQAASQGRGNASRAWDEFKPFQKENKRTQARAAAASSSGGDSAAPTEASECVLDPKAASHLLLACLMAAECCGDM